MTETPPTHPTPLPGPGHVGAGRQVRLKTVLIVGGVIIGVVLSFVAGVAFENNRIKSELEEAFSDIDSSGDDFLSDDSDDSEEVPDPVELKVGETIETDDPYGEGRLAITLTSVDYREASESYDDQPSLARNMIYFAKVENVGDGTVSVNLGGEFEGDSGQVYEFAGVFCQDGSELSGEIDPGQFIEGCSTSDLPAESGKFVFSDFDEPFYIEVPAA